METIMTYYADKPCEWPGCTQTGNPHRDDGWHWYPVKRHGGALCPTHGARLGHLFRTATTQEELLTGFDRLWRPDTSDHQ
jgi:hypothetical protein